MKYEYAPDLQRIAIEMARLLFPHIQIHNIMCFRSYGTSSKTTIARCHALDKIMQKALGRSSAFYAIEVLTENFESLDEEEKMKTILHELMHIPKAFGGGFKHHNFVTERNVAKHFKEYKKRKRNFSKNSNTNQKDGTNENYQTKLRE